MSHVSTYKPSTGIEKWLDKRLPIVRFGADFMEFPTPKNLNYWWTFGAILAVCLVIQILTGVILAQRRLSTSQDTIAEFLSLLCSLPICTEENDDGDAEAQRRKVAHVNA